MEELKDDIIITEDDLRDLRDVRAALLKERHGQVDVDAAWEAFEQQMGSEQKERISHSITIDDTEQSVTKTAHIRYLVLGTILGVAASLLCFVLLRPILLPQTEDNNSLLVSEFIEQEDNQVEMITSLNGESSKVNVQSTAYHVKDAGEEILDFSKQVDDDGPVEERVITTPRGKVQTIILTDGTRVLLNNESRLQFPTRFTGDTRTVLVEGEAYFTVAKDASHPFIVRSRDISTTALGTKFNVKAYKDKAIHITLVDGSVRVTDGNNQEVILKPGEDVSTVNDKLVIADADTKTYKQWEEGYFYYDNVPLIDVLIELGRWYNVNIELQNRKLMSYRLHFIADRNASIDDALERLNEFRYLHAERKGDKIIVSEKNIQQ